jgi:glucose-1-phosphate thymidylyltransferase
MKGILLAGGTGSRLYPSTKVTNKHLLNVYDKPMIEYPLKTLLDLGIKDIIVVTGTEHSGAVIKYLQDKEGINFTFKIQRQPDGIAGALMLCKELLDSDTIVILGDNVFEETPDIQKENGCFLVVKEVTCPERFGVAVIEEGKIKSVVEKPKEFLSNKAITGLYKFDDRLPTFLDNLSKSQRGEYEITDIINKYLVEDGYVNYCLYNKFWSDAGTPESLYECSTLLQSNKIKRVAIYTANFGGKDTYQSPIEKTLMNEKGYVIDCFYFTDSDIQIDGVVTRQLPPFCVSPRKSARFIKTASHLLFKDYDYTIWVDGRLKLTKPISDYINLLDNGNHVAVCKHPDRDCIYKEYAECVKQQLDDIDIMTHQITSIKEKGYPENNGLAETGILVRDSSEVVNQLNKYWCEFIVNHSIRDQLSFNYVMWALNENYSIIPEDFRKKGKHLVYD